MSKPLKKVKFGKKCTELDLYARRVSKNERLSVCPQINRFEQSLIESCVLKQYA